MSTLPAILGAEYELIDFERRLQGSDAVNVNQFALCQRATSRVDSSARSYG